MTIGTIVRRFESLVSTNDTARELIRAGAVHGTVVVADEQTRGRGTKGRTWHSPGGLGLYASFILRWDDPGERNTSFSLLPLAAGLAAAEAVFESAGVDVGLKWPNDLVFGRRKLGGILTETVLRAGGPGHAVIGVGININHREDDFPGDLKETATSVRLIRGRESDREALLSSLCRSLDCWYNSLIRGGRKTIIRSYENRMAFRPGTRIRATTVRGERSGVFRGLAPDGRLNLSLAGGPEFVSFEEVQALDWE
jgi:BirA family biotin operon repressor/biotin-[acetyl-CoA-carboxylase] ligase